MMITGCSVSGNVAGESGGGIYSTWYSQPVIFNSILWGDFAPTGPEISVFPYEEVSPMVSVSYCNVQDGAAGAYVEGSCTLDWGVGNTDTDPCFAWPGSEVHRQRPVVGGNRRPLNHPIRRNIVPSR